MTEVNASEVADPRYKHEDEWEWRQHLGATGLHYHKPGPTPFHDMIKVELSHVGHEYEPKIGETVVFELAQKDIRSFCDNEPKACTVIDSTIKPGYGRVYVLRDNDGKVFRAYYTCIFHPLYWIQFNWGRTEARRYKLESDRYRLTVERNVLREILTSQGIRVVSDAHAKELGIKS